MLLTAHVVMLAGLWYMNDFGRGSTQQAQDKKTK